MKAVFADTSYYIALLTKSDVQHQKAMELTRNHNGPVVTTAFVLLELGNYWSAIPNRTTFANLLTVLQSAADLTILPLSAVLFDEGIQLFSSRPDKNWSLVDCISFKVMRQQNLAEAWTADHHFAQAGFNALLI